MEEYVYILREDFYNEWSWECGATHLLYVSTDKYYVVDKLRECLNLELSEDKDRILENLYGKTDIDNIITDTIEILVKNGDIVNVDVYVNKDDYDNGKNSATFVIEKMGIK